MHYYQFNIAVWALHTAHLTLEEEAIYRRLLDFYYDTEMPIPKKTHRVIRRLRLGSYEETVGLILEEFFTLESDGWHNNRADIELQEYHRKGEIARANGKKGGRPKKAKSRTAGLPNQEETQSVILANPDVTQKKPNGKLTKNYKLITNNQELETNSDCVQSPKAQKAKRFVAPTLDQVSDYMAERNLEALKIPNESEKFFDYYSANGWKAGRNPMKDWKAAIRNWLKNDFTSSTKSNGSLSSSEKRQQEINQRNESLFGNAGAVPQSPPQAVQPSFLTGEVIDHE